MLNFLRESLKTGAWPKIVLAAVAIGLIAYLGAYFSGDTTSRGEPNWAAQVNGEPISGREFLRTARNIDQQYRQIFGANYEQAKQQFQIGRQAIQRLIERELILQDAAKLGIGVTEDELVEYIRKSESLKDPNTGEFVGRENYVRAISRAYPGGVPAFERDMRNDLVMDKWTALVTQSASISEDEMVEAFRQQTERTAVSYVVLPSSEQNLDARLEDDEIQAWYESHAEEYRRGEGRNIRYVVVERQAMLEQIEISDQELQSSYEANQANYSHSEQRSARHILFRVAPNDTPERQEATRKTAEAVLERVRSGEDFAELAGAYSQDPGSAERGGDLGFFGRGEMVAPFEEAAFGTAVGEIAPLVQSSFGFHIIQVTGERPAGVTPLEDVAEELRRSLELRAAQDRVVIEAQRLRGEISEPDQLETVAAAEGLTVETRFVSREDRLSDLGVAPEFMETVFDLEAGSVSSPLRTATGMALVAVDEIVPSSVAPLSEVIETVRTDLLNDKLRQMAVSAGERALSRGADFDAVAQALGKLAQESGDLAPGASLPETGGTSPAMEEKLFGPGVMEGDRGVAQVPAGALVYEIVRRQPFDSYAFEDARSELRDGLLEQRRIGLQRSILDRLSEQQEILVNERMIERIDGASAEG